MTLSSVAKLLVEDFLPESRKIYLFKNYKQSSSYRSYKEIVPVYLRERPRNVILHCLHRQAGSLKFTEEDIQDVDPDSGRFKVVKCGKKERIKNFGQSSNMPSCNCLDWERFHLPCKHFFAIFRFRPAWTWDMLPKSYLESSYLSLDNQALQSYYQESLTPSTVSESLGVSQSLETEDNSPGNDYSTNFEDEIPHKKV